MNGQVTQHGVVTAAQINQIRSDQINIIRETPLAEIVRQMLLSKNIQTISTQSWVFISVNEWSFPIGHNAST